MKVSIIKKTNSLWFILGILLLILIWIISSNYINNNIVIPKISEVARAFKNIFIDKNSYLIIINTLVNLLIVVLTSFLIAIVLAFLASIINPVKMILKPIISLFRSIPVASIIIILLMIVGNKNTPYFITFFVIMPIMYEGILKSINNVDKNIIEEIKMISNTNLMVVTKVYIPIISPYIFTVILSTLGLGFKVMVMSEFITNANNTIGYTMLQEKQMLNIDSVFAWTIVLIILVLLLETLINRIEQHFNLKYNQE